MWRIIKVLLVLAVICGLGVLAFAYVGPFLFPAEFAAPQQDVTLPITLDLE